jgi:hypothetical protein
MNLLPNVKITKVAEAAASGGTDVNGSVLDMQGFDGVLFCTNIATANAGNFLKAQQGQASNLSDAADLAGTKVTSGSSDEAVVLDLHKPLERYVRPVIVRGGANTSTGEIWAIQYISRSAPRTSDLAGTLASKIVVSPAEGTP